MPGCGSGVVVLPWSSPRSQHHAAVTRKIHLSRLFRFPQPPLTVASLIVLFRWLAGVCLQTPRSIRSTCHCPQVVGLGQAVLDPVGFAEHVKAHGPGIDGVTVKLMRFSWHGWDRFLTSKLSNRAPRVRMISKIWPRLGRDQSRQMAQDDPGCRRLMSMPGEGAVVALTYRSAVDDPSRFTSSRNVGPWVGYDALTQPVGRHHQGRRCQLAARVVPSRDCHEAPWALHLAEKMGRTGCPPSWRKACHGDLGTAYQRDPSPDVGR